MQWLWWLVWYGPHKALDWHDTKGGIDHGKAAADLVIFALAAGVVYVAVTSKTFPPVLWGIVLIAGAMGSRMFIAFLRSRGGDK